MGGSGGVGPGSKIPIAGGGSFTIPKPMTAKQQAAQTPQQIADAISAQFPKIDPSTFMPGAAVSGGGQGFSYIYGGPPQQAPAPAPSAPAPQPVQPSPPPPPPPAPPPPPIISAPPPNVSLPTSFDRTSMPFGAPPTQQATAYSTPQTSGPGTQSS